MNEKRELLIKFFEIVLGLIIGYFAFILSPNQTGIEGLLSITIGLLSTLVIGSIVESYRQSQNANNFLLQLSQLIKIMSESQVDNNNLVRVMHHSMVTWSRDQIPPLWLEFLWSVETRFYATSYISPKEGWDQAYTTLGFEIQKAKIRVKNADIRRVFIVDDDQELTQIRKTLCGQEQIGIKTKYITKDTINTKSMLKTMADKLESIDFAVIDSRFVILTILDKNRMIKHGKLITDKSQCSLYIKFYESLLAEADEIDHKSI